MQRELLLKLSFFQGLTEAQIVLIERFVESCTYPQDLSVFKQGDQAKYLFLLLSGGVSIQHKLYDGPKIKIAQIDPGGVFGWSCVLGRKKLYVRGHHNY